MKTKKDAWRNSTSFSHSWEWGLGLPILGFGNVPSHSSNQKEINDLFIYIILIFSRFKSHGCQLFVIKAVPLSFLITRYFVTTTILFSFETGTSFLSSFQKETPNLYMPAIQLQTSYSNFLNALVNQLIFIKPK